MYLLYGQEQLFIERFVDKLVALTDAGTAVRFDYEEDGIEEALLELQTVSLFLQQPVVVLRNCTGFLTQGKSNGQLDMLENYIQNPVGSRTLVVIVPGDKLDERKKVTKAAKRRTVVNCQTPKQPVAIRMLEAEVRTRQTAIEPDALAELWRRTASVTQAVNELHKLALYALQRTIVIADVQLLVAKTLEESVFDWVDHVTQGRIAPAAAMLLDMYRQGYDALALLAMLARQFRLMWYAKALQPKMRLEDVAKEAKAHPYAMRVADKQSRNFSLAAVEYLLTLAADCEYDIKRGRRDGQQAIELLMLTCAGSTKTGRRAQ